MSRWVSMMEAVSDFVMTYLDPIGVVMGIVVAFPVFRTWALVGREYRHRRRWFREVRKKPGRRPAILIVDLLPAREVRQQVENWRRGHRALADIPDDRIFELRRDGWLQSEDLPSLHEDIGRQLGRVASAGCDTLHLFYAGPVAPALVLGARLANGPRVLLYQHHAGEYMPFGPLEMWS